MGTRLWCVSLPGYRLNKAVAVILSSLAGLSMLVSLLLPGCTKPVQGTVRAHTLLPTVDLQDAQTGGTSSVGSWPMAGANPQRTSWTSEEVPGKLNPIWYRVIEPYIAPHVQIIAANGLLYISTASGLYALDATTGETAWVYPTELPLGNAPTVFNGVVYVGGYDHKLYALDAITGQFKWAYEATAGFVTNPLVLEMDGRTLIYAGNRDGYLYAVEDLGTTPDLLWSYQTQGPILFSAAYVDDTVYVVSNDSYTYALDARTGDRVWQSPKLPGAGFHAWWPVIYQNPTLGADVVILAGSSNYRFLLEPSYGYDLQGRETNDVWPDRANQPRGTLFGTLNPDGTVNARRVLQYFEAKPWRRTYIILDRQTGQEVTFDFDGDGKPEYAPVLWHGTHSGNRYPPIVGADGLLYQSNTYMSDPNITAGQVSGWKYGTPAITVASPLWKAMDEPLAYSAGGNVIYWSHCNDRSAGAFDISIPNDRIYPENLNPNREWVYFDAVGLVSRLPGYNILYEGLNPTNYGINSLFRGTTASSNGIYGQHGHQNPPIPYVGRVYLHRSNAVIAFGNYTGNPVQLPRAATLAAPAADLSTSGYELRQKLEAEVSKMLNAGHLRPGYRSHGILDAKSRDQLGDHITDYWHNSADTLYVLALTLPYLSADLQGQVKTYMQSEFAAYPPYEYTHVGWRDGAPREPYELPQEVEADRVNHPPAVSGYGYDGWTWPPSMFYALWKYAEVFGGAESIFTASRSRLESPPTNAYLIEYPYIHNAYIAGYLGYLQLEALAGYPESASVRTTLNRLLALRASSFSKDTPYTDGTTGRSFSVARNFMFLVPELGQYLRENILSKVEAAVDEYSRVAPYWFVADYYTAHGESANQHFYDYHALFQARALILRESGVDLVKYLDVPAVQVGDLFYIHNLVALLDAGLGGELEKSVAPSAGWQGDVLSYALRFSGSGHMLTLTDTLPLGVSAPADFNLEGTSVLPVYNAETHQLLWTSDDVSEGNWVTLRYNANIVSTIPQSLFNTAVLDLGTTAAPITVVALVIANPYQCYLPVIMKTD